MSKRGPIPVSPGELYLLAQGFYWDFRRLSGGGPRQLFDTNRHEKLEAMIEKPNLRLSPHRKVQLRQRAEDEVRAGRLKVSEKEDWLHQREEGELSARRINRGLIASRLTTRIVKIRSERDDLDALLEATKPEQVRRICKKAQGTTTVKCGSGAPREVEVWNWPISAGSMFPAYLSEYAVQFIAAKQDPRYPRSDRPTNELKQLWFLARALAGAVLGIQPRTAVNLVGSKRPEQLFEESRAAKPERKRTR